MQTKAAPKTEAATATATATAEAPEKRKFVALMSPAAIRHAANTRPELAALLKGQSVRCRLLGAGNAQQGQKKVPALDINQDIDADTTVIGFGVPVNVLVNAKEGIEIPLGKLPKTRSHYSNNAITDADTKEFINSMTELGRVSLRCYKAQLANLEIEDDAEGFVDDVEF